MRRNSLEKEEIVGRKNMNKGTEAQSLVWEVYCTSYKTGILDIGLENKLRLSCEGLKYCTEKQSLSLNY